MKKLKYGMLFLVSAHLLQGDAVLQMHQLHLKNLKPSHPYRLRVR